MRDGFSFARGLMADLKEGIVKMFVFFAAIHLLYMAGVAAFNPIVYLLFVGGPVAIVLYILAVLTAYLTTFQEYATLKQVFAFSVTSFLLAFPVDWLVKNAVVPDATSWSGLALHVVLGVLALSIAPFAVARGDVVMERLSIGS